MTILKLFLIVVSLNAISFGGGSILLVGLEHQLVPGVITPGQFATGMALGQSTPGPLAAFTTAIGAAALGWPGAVAATAGLVVVSLAAVMLIHRVPQAWFQAPRVRGALAVVPPFVAGLVIYLGIKMMKDTHATQFLVPAVILGGVVTGRLKKVPTPVLVVGALAVGMLLQGKPITGW